MQERSWRYRAAVLVVSLVATASAAAAIPVLDWPVAAPRITQDYACLNCTPASGFHSGIDMTDAVFGSCTVAGPAVRSAANDGTVYRIQTGCPNNATYCSRGFGNHVIVQHSIPGGETLFLVYAHLNSVNVSIGQGNIDQGDQIGLMGTSSVEACHLHFDVLDFAPGSPGLFEFPTEPAAMGYDPYQNDYPSESCNGGSGHCLDAKKYFARDGFLVGLPGGVPVRETPAPGAPCVTEVGTGQAYVSIAEYGTWHYIMLPSDVGPDAPTGGSGSCLSNSVFGWTNPGPATPAFGFEVQVDGAALGGAGLNVRDQASGSVLTKVWGGHYFWGTGNTSPSDANCNLPWYEMDVPSLRADGSTKGWVCSVYLIDPGGGQCSPFVKGACGAPTADTELPSGVTQASATLNSTINPNGASTEVWFVWEKNDSTPDANESPVPHADVGEGSTPLPFSWTLGGLDCESTYYYYAKAENALGTDTGGTLSLTTDDCGGGGGTQTIELVVNGDFDLGHGKWQTIGDFHIGQASFPNSPPWYAFLANGDWDPDDDLVGFLKTDLMTLSASTEAAVLSFWYSISTNETTITQEYDLLFIYLQDDSGGILETWGPLSNLDANGSPGNYDEWSISIPSEHFGLDVQISFIGQTDFSLPTVFRIDDVSLEAIVPDGGPPSVTTNIADQITETTARLNLTVNPNGLDTEVWFDFEANDPTPNDDTEHIGVGSGTTSQALSISVVGLDCDTEYYYEANASNVAGSDDGSTLSFFTDGCSGGPPTADTDPAGNITSLSAELRGDILPNGLPTTAYYEWGPSPSLGNTTPPQSVGSGLSWVDFPQQLSGLACETTYYFRAYAQNSAGSDADVTYSFTTTDCDAPVPSDELLLYANRPQCNGSEPAVVFGWTMPANADPLITLRRSDGLYVATVNTAVTGPVYLVDSGLSPGVSYDFTLEAEIAGETRVSNQLKVFVYSFECDLPMGSGDLPHRPAAWVETPYCEGGVPKVRIRWSEVIGASSYDVLRLVYFPGSSTTYSGLSGTEFVDDAIAAGSATIYRVAAVNAAGTRESYPVSVIVPGTICADPGHPGAFAASAQEPVCDVDNGSMVVTWTAAANAASNYRRYLFDEFLIWTGGDNDDDLQHQARPLTPGAVARVAVQSQSSIDPDQFREANTVSKLIPLDICGPGSDPPSVSGSIGWYVEEEQAFLRSSIIPKGSPATAFFDFGTDTNYGLVTPERDVGSGFDFVTIGEIVTGLTCGTTYHFRLVGSNAVGTTLGSDSALTTDPCSNQAPAALDDAYATLENSVLSVAPVDGVLANDTDPNDDPLEAQLVSTTNQGILDLNTAGSFTYTPTQEFVGIDTFTYESFDGITTSNVATVTIIVEPSGCVIDLDCDNGLFCDGAETCDPILDCQAGTPPSCDDGVSCTDDACNEESDSCDHTADHGSCNDGLFCDGAETCDPILDCQTGSDPCAPMACDEGSDICIEAAIFADGFESGDTSEWSAEVP